MITKEVTLSILTPVYTPVQTGRRATVHAVPGMDVAMGRPVTALCGRTITPGAGRWDAIYFPRTWPVLVAQWRRIGRTHVTFTCGHCARRTPYQTARVFAIGADGAAAREVITS
jgi:hypothetical protein